MNLILRRINIMLRFYSNILLSLLIFCSCSFASTENIKNSTKTNEANLTNKAFVLHSRKNSEKTLTRTNTFVYKKINGIELKAHIFNSETPSTLKTAIVFFHGGGWVEGSAHQFDKQARYFMDRGLVSITIDYRIKKRNGTTPFEALQDAKSAIRWIRENAADFNIDPRRIIVAGGSAGGQLAVATAIIENINDPSDNLKMSAIPDALVLFNPVLDTKKWEHLFKIDLSAISPLQNLSKMLPPTIIFHGTKDKVAPYEVTRKFVKKAQDLGSNNIRLVTYPNRAHSFFNSDSKGNNDFTTTTQETLKFIKELGW